MTTRRPPAVLGPPGRFRDALAELLATTAGAGDEAAAVWAAPRDADPARGAPAGLAEALRSGIHRLVVVSSTAVVEPNAHHPGLVDEGFRGSARTGNPLPARWRVLEAAAADAVRGSPVVLTVLRPTPVLVPEGRDFWSRLFRRRLAPTIAGMGPTLQLLDLRDLAAAIAAALAAPAERARGIFHVAPTGVVPLRRAIRLAGGHRLPLPRWLLRLLGRHPEELEGIRYPATVDATAIRKRLGFAPRLSSAAAVVAHADRRRPEPSWRSAPPGPEPEPSWRSAPPGSEPEPSWRSAPPGSHPKPVAERGAGTAERQLGSALDLEFDPFGFDRAYVDRLGRTLFRFLHDVWWRIESEGLERFPSAGRVVLAGFHRGFQPWDGVMTLHHLATRRGRYPRFLIHPTLVKFPFLAPYMTQLGGLHASQENAARILESEEVLGIYPEGIRGTFTPYRLAYRIGPSWRHDFARLAIRHRAPIVPVVNVGAAEIYPILARLDWKAFQRWSEWPFFPITPTMGTLPLPSKWHLHFLEPLPVEADWGPEAAEDPARVAALSAEVRRRMEAALADGLARRPAIFWGRLRPSADGAVEGGPEPPREPGSGGRYFRRR